MTRAVVGRPAPLGVLLLAIVVVAGLGACGGSDGKRAEPRSWAGTFCRSFSSYERAVGDLSNRFNETVRSSPAEDLAGRKAALVDYLSGSIARTDEFLRALNGAGEPKVRDGADLVGNITDGFRDLRTTLADAGHDAKQLPESDPAVFGNTVGRIANLISTGSNRSRETISRARTQYETRELDRAFNRAPACQQIG